MLFDLRQPRFFSTKYIDCLCLGFYLSLVFTVDAAAVDEKVGQDSVSLAQEECRFSGRFQQQKHIAGLTQPATSEGKFLYDCEQGVVWATQQPELDVLVLKVGSVKQKPKAYRLIDDQINALKGRQSRFLAEFIMSLMAADKTPLNSAFKIQSQDAGGLLLTPKKRQLKRAIKQIEVSENSATETNALPSRAITIAITDRNHQRTVIMAQKQLPVAQHTLSSCESYIGVTAVCELLLAEEASTSVFEAK